MLSWRIETRHFKHFNKGKCLSDLNQLSWANVDLCSDPNDMWLEWKEMFLGCVDKHAPLKLKRIRKKRSPWIASELLCKIRKRDFLKKKAISSNNSATWDQFKRARNQANNVVKLANGDAMFLTTWMPTKAIRAKHGKLSTSWLHVTVVSRLVFWKSRQTIE